MLKHSYWMSISIVVVCLFAVVAFVTHSNFFIGKGKDEAIPPVSESTKINENSQYVCFELIDDLPYDSKNYIEITSLVEQYGGLQCMVAQITSEDERVKFNESFLKYGIEVPEHNFGESFLLVSGECEIESIVVSSINSDNGTVSDLDISFCKAGLVGDKLFLYKCEKVYLS